MNDASRHLVALEQCGLELQAPHLRTTTKRRIETGTRQLARSAAPFGVRRRCSQSSP